MEQRHQTGSLIHQPSQDRGRGSRAQRDGLFARIAGELPVCGNEAELTEANSTARAGAIRDCGIRRRSKQHEAYGCAGKAFYSGRLIWEKSTAFGLTCERHSSVTECLFSDGASRQGTGPRYPAVRSPISVPIRLVWTTQSSQHTQRSYGGAPFDIGD